MRNKEIIELTICNGLNVQCLNQDVDLNLINDLDINCSGKKKKNVLCSSFQPILMPTDDGYDFVQHEKHWVPEILNGEYTHVRSFIIVEVISEVKRQDIYQTGRLLANRAYIEDEEIIQLAFGNNGRMIKRLRKGYLNNKFMPSMDLLVTEFGIGKRSIKTLNLIKSNLNLTTVKKTNRVCTHNSSKANKPERKRNNQKNGELISDSQHANTNTNVTNKTNKANISTNDNSINTDQLISLKWNEYSKKHGIPYYSDLLKKLNSINPNYGASFENILKKDNVNLDECWNKANGIIKKSITIKKWDEYSNKHGIPCHSDLLQKLNSINPNYGSAFTKHVEDQNVDLNKIWEKANKIISVNNNS